MITLDQYETFRNNINALIQEYREKFSVPVITDSKKYGETYSVNANQIFSKNAS